MAPDGENFRGVNAVRLFSGAEGLTLDSLIGKGYDRYLPAMDLLIPALIQAVRENAPSLDTRTTEAVRTLNEWDRRAAVHSVATTLAIEWGMRMQQYAPKPRVPEDATRGVDNLQREIETAGGTRMLSELNGVLTDLEQRFGSWKIEWGELCRYQRLTGKIAETYDDAKPSLPVGLVSSAFGALPSVQSRVMKDTKKRYAFSGNSFIAAVEFGKKIRAKTIVTGGESSDPSSPHFSDQAEMYLDGRFKDVLFYKEDILRAAEKTYHPGDE
jgi:acyl-homoserine lactone acylase PvdQ